MKIRDILNERNIDTLPKGSIFDDAKRIDGIFDMSTHTWSETVEVFERNKKSAKLKYIDINKIKITQRNIQSNKVKNIINVINSTPLINLVKFNDGEIVAYDGHHRLAAYWAIGKNKIKANIVDE